MIEQLRAYTAFKEKPCLVPPIHTWHFTAPVIVQLSGHRVPLASEGTCTHLHIFIHAYIHAYIYVYNFK